MDEHIAPATRDGAAREAPQARRDGRTVELSERIKNWLGIAAILIAAPWAIWKFIYKEIVQPRQVPVNISLNLEMQKVPVDGRGGTRLMAVELSVKATNPSTRVVYLLPSAWSARAYKVQPMQAHADFADQAGSSISANKIRPVEKYANQSNSETVAAGRLFADDELKPSETIARRIVFHLPPGTFNVVEVWTCVPSTSEAHGIGIVWWFEDDALRWQMTRKGKPIPERKADDKPSEDFQQSFSRAAMSL